jgi:hypothetical protein
MPDVAVILGVPFGQATFTCAPTGGDTVTIPGSRRWLYGPAQFGNPSCNGQFELQVPSTDTGQTANTYRWIGDVPASGSALTAFTYAGNTFKSLGGI